MRSGVAPPVSTKCHSRPRSADAAWRHGSGPSWWCRERLEHGLGEGPSSRVAEPGANRGVGLQGKLQLALWRAGGRPAAAASLQSASAQSSESSTQAFEAGDGQAAKPLPSRSRSPRALDL